MSENGKIQPNTSAHVEENHRNRPRHSSFDRMLPAGFKNEDIAAVVFKSSSPAAGGKGNRKSLTKPSPSPFIQQQRQLMMRSPKGNARKDEERRHMSVSDGAGGFQELSHHNAGNDQIYWRRKPGNTRLPHSLVGSIPPPPTSFFGSPTIRNCGVPRKGSSTRSGGTSRQRSRTPTVKERKKDGEKLDPDMDSKRSLQPGDFSDQYEIYWQRNDKDTEHIPTSPIAKAPQNGTPAPLKSMIEVVSSASTTFSNNSTRLTSLNGSEASLRSSSSSTTSDSKPPMLKRKGSTSRVALLRKQMKEQQRAELSNQPDVASRETSIKGHTAPGPKSEQKRSYEWNERGSTPRQGSQKSLLGRTHSDRKMEFNAANQTQKVHPEHPCSSQSSSSASSEGRETIKGVYRDVNGKVISLNGHPISEVPTSLARTRSQGTTRSRPSMRNMLRNKRKLERELDQSEVFHYVLHKCPRSAFQKQASMGSLGIATATSTSSNSVDVGPHQLPRRSVSSSSKISNTGSARGEKVAGPKDSKMHLDRFLKMKHLSEEIVEKIEDSHHHQIGGVVGSAKLRHHEPQKVEDTWHDSHSLDNFITVHDRESCVGHQTLESALSLLRMSNTDEIEDEDKTIETEDLNDTPRSQSTEKCHPRHDDDEADSFISLDWKDLPSAWSNVTNECVRDSGPATNSDRSQRQLWEPQILSRSLDHLIANEQQDEDDQQEPLDNCDGHNSTNPPNDHLQVENFSMVDPSGRRSSYSGGIAKSSGMPNGMGKLEFHDRGQVFLGQFVHGWWSGYGTCTHTRTGEEYTGYFLDYVQHGHGVSRYADGSVFEGTFSKGSKLEGKMTYPDQSIYLGKFDEKQGGERCGRGTYIFSNGAVFFGEFMNDKFHGEGVLTYVDGKRFIGRWSEGLRHGPGKDFRPDGRINREGLWQEGRFVSFL